MVDENEKVDDEEETSSEESEASEALTESDSGSDEGADAEEDDEEEDDEEEDDEEQAAASEPPPASEPPRAASEPPRSERPVARANVRDDDDGDPGHVPPGAYGPDADDPDRVPALYLAEFDTTSGVLHAAEKVRDAGFTKWDVHTPFPIHGMDGAMGLTESKLGLIVFGAGATGLIGAFLMMLWMNGIDYPLIIGGKPPESIPSMVPILFECTVLLSGITAVFGMLGLNKLPRHHHPIFYSKRFERGSDDRFFISIEAGDPKFDLDKTRELLSSLHPTHIELVEESLP